MKVEDGAILIDNQFGGWDDAFVAHRASEFTLFV